MDCLTHGSVPVLLLHVPHASPYLYRRSVTLLDTCSCIPRKEVPHGTLYNLKPQDKELEYLKEKLRRMEAENAGLKCVLILADQGWLNWLGRALQLDAAGLAHVSFVLDVGGPCW